MVYQDIILGADLVEVVACLYDMPLHVITLCPSVEAVTAREAGRDKIGLWLDSSALSRDQTVDHILANLEQARITDDF